MFFRDWFKRQAPILALAIVSFSVTNVFLRPILLAICIEGGVYRGFPFAYYTQCAEASGRSLGTPYWNPGSLLVDLVVWYLAATAVVLLYRRIRQP